MKLKLLLLFFSTQFLFSQITFTEVKKLGDTTKAKIFKYDGKSEFLKDYYKLFVDLNPEYYGNDEKRHKDLLNYYKQYIGYDLFFLGKPVIFTNKKSQEYIHPKAKSPIITKLYYPICKNCTSARYFDKEKVVNDSIKSYISEYKILEVSFKAKDFGFDNERITYEENSPIFQDEYTIKC